MNVVHDMDDSYRGVHICGVNWRRSSITKRYFEDWRMGRVKGEANTGDEASNGGEACDGGKGADIVEW